MSLISTSILLEILLALNSIEQAPASLQARTQAEVVIERICATRQTPEESLDCAIDVLVGLSEESVVVKQ